MEMAAAHYTVGRAEVWIRCGVSRIGLIVSIDPFQDIPGHVLHTVRARAVCIRADFCRLIRAKSGASRLWATAPGPHPLSRRTRSPGSRFFPFFFSWETFVGPRSVGRRIVEVYAHDGHPRLSEVFVVPPWIRRTFPLRFLAKLLVLLICDFKLVDIVVWQSHLMRGLLVEVVTVVSDNEFAGWD